MAANHETRSMFDQYDIVDDNDLKEASAKLRQRLAERSERFRNLSERPMNGSGAENTASHRKQIGRGAWESVAPIVLSRRKPQFLQ